MQFRTTIQGSLSAESKQNAIGPFFLDDFGNEMSIYRQKVNLIGYTFRGLNSCDVRIN